MKAKCPHCNNGCEKCQGTGFISVSFAEGDLFTRLCLNPRCQFVNGGRICDGFPPESSGPCVICGGETDWAAADDPRLQSNEEAWVENQYEFYCKRLEKDVEALRGRMKELRDFAKSIPGYADLQLTLEQAKLMHVCRICKQSDKPRTLDNKVDPFILKYGEEYAHESCLRGTQTPDNQV